MIWKLSERKDWNSLEQQFGWVRDMNQVPQHTVHHAEGSVAVHTRMVLEALLRQPAYPMLPEQEREILWAAALLHDVEKRSTSVDEGNGQEVSSAVLKILGGILFCAHSTKRAQAPAVRAQAAEVPLIVVYVFWRDGAETLTPGAVKSGFISSSRVKPLLEFKNRLLL